MKKDDKGAMCQSINQSLSNVVVRAFTRNQADLVPLVLIIGMTNRLQPIRDGLS